MAKNDSIEISKFRKNIMGTLSFDMKLPNMRKSQDFIVYPVNEKTDYITIQSDTRFGKIEMTTGRGLMSQSHPNGAYAVHLHIDKLVKFELTESQLENLKQELAKTAGRNVGSAGVVSDNEYANKFADGGIMDEATLDEIESGFTVRQFNEITKRLFPYSFGFKVYKPINELDTKGFSAPDYDINGYYGFNDEEIGSKLYFPVYKRDHNIQWNITQGGENTYFNFNLEDKEGNLWIGTFGFKDRGDVSPEYITSFIAFLMQCYGLPFKVKHTAYAKGGEMSNYNGAGRFAKGGSTDTESHKEVTLIFDGEPHKYDMVFVGGELDEVNLPYSMGTKLWNYLENEFDDWMDNVGGDYEQMYFGEEAIYSKRGAIQGAIEIIEDTIYEDKGKKTVYNLDKGEVDTMAAFS